VNIVIKRKNSISLIKRIYSPKLIENCKVSLADTNWNDIFLQTWCAVNPNSPYAMLIEKYTILFEKYFPMQPIKFSKKTHPWQAWMTKGLTSSCFKKSI